MPSSKDLKRLARTRMQKTGESYTTARAQLLKKKTARTTPAADLAVTAGMSDAAVNKATGGDWKKWVRVLDAIDAASMKHKDIALHLHEEHDLDGWWAQTVTVGYERIRGLREKGQRRGGHFEMSKSRTLPVPIGKLYAAFATKRAREKWLPGAEITVKKATKDKSVRWLWADGTPVEVYFWKKGAAKAQVQVQHRELPSRKDADAMRAFWTERLAELAVVLKP